MTQAESTQLGAAIVTLTRVLVVFAVSTIFKLQNTQNGRNPLALKGVDFVQLENMATRMINNQ